MLIKSGGIFQMKVALLFSPSESTVSSPKLKSVFACTGIQISACYTF